jgi:hypothetical protein
MLTVEIVPSTAGTEAAKTAFWPVGTIVSMTAANH